MFSFWVATFGEAFYDLPDLVVEDYFYIGIGIELEIYMEVVSEGVGIVGEAELIAFGDFSFFCGFGTGLIISSA